MGRKGRHPAEAPGQPGQKATLTMTILNKIRALTLVKDTRGLSTVEYVILIVLIAAVAIGVWGEFGSLVKDQLTDSKQDIETELNKER